MMTVQNILDHMAGQLRLPSYHSATDGAKRDLVTYLNAALQRIWVRLPEDAREHFTRGTFTLSVTGGEGEYELETDIQRVLGPVIITATGQPLLVISSMGESKSFGPRYFGAEVTGEPLAYYVSTGRGLTPKLLLHPVPTDDTEIEYIAELRCPRVTSDDACDDEATIPLPHEYVESLLLPVAVMHASRSSWFNDEAKFESIAADAADALEAFGMTDVAPSVSEDRSR